MSRTKETNEIVRNHIVAAMAAGFVPFPFLDIAAVSAVQLDMLSKLASWKQAGGCPVSIRG